MQHTPRYSALIIAIHWLTLLLMLVSVGLIYGRELYGKELIADKAVRSQLVMTHASLGLTILALTVLRIPLRLFGPDPGTEAELPPWMRLASRVGHWLLYFGLLAVPLIGWPIPGAGGREVTYFGLFTVPSLVSELKDLKELLEEIHETGAFLLFGLIGLHAAAALYHHYVRHDGILRAMMPTMAPPDRPTSR